jgi:hypothetical protein
MVTASEAIGIYRRGRKVLAFAAMSLLLLWHTGAILIGPAPDGVTTNAIRAIYEPYLTFFRLKNEWGFFAPNVRVDPVFRYILEDAAGQRTIVTPAERLSRLHPDEIWEKDWYTHAIDEYEIYGPYIGAWLCRHHAAMHPARVTLIHVEQSDFMPADQRAGKQPSDPEFNTEHVLITVGCAEKQP